MLGSNALWQSSLGGNPKPPGELWKGSARRPVIQGSEWLLEEVDTIDDG